MAAYPFAIRLTSDAEPGSGLGGEVTNALVPRDCRGRPVIPGSHIKGLMRQALGDMAARLQWDEDLLTRVFGGHNLPEDQSRNGIEAAFHIGDATAENPPETLLITRTAVEESGVAKDTSLRTSESVPRGTVFHGVVRSGVPEGCVEDLAWRLALLSLGAIGGGRNRGCGECVVEIPGETRSPGQLLRALAEALREEAWRAAGVAPRIPRPVAAEKRMALSGRAVVLRLVFRASSPICCPEIPDKTNVMITGFSIPASAVQGAILNRLDRLNPSLAAAVYESPLFRAWPLQPCRASTGQEEACEEELPVPYRVSLTHRAAKFSLPEEPPDRHFFDEALDPEPYDWTQVARGAPLKASDGVLLRWGRSGEVLLWKAAAMPHAITTHGVHNDPETADGRNLFTVDAMAPLVWQGLVVMPEDAAQTLLDALEEDPFMALGKSRGVRGLGALRAEIVEGIPPEWQTHTAHTVLIAQSPLLLPDRAPSGATAEEELMAVAISWARAHGLPEPQAKRSWANVGIRFGWNRHENGRQRACRVILPGSVIAFSEKLDGARLAEALKHSGMGQPEGRQRGFGAVSVHPGKARGFYPARPEPFRVAAPVPGRFREAVELVLKIRQAALGAGRLPSPSQIRAVQQRLEKAGKKAALDYLNGQTERTIRIWFTWEPILPQIETLLSNFEPEVASRALELLANLAIVDQQER